MPRLYVSGIPGSGKTDVILKTQELAKKCGKTVYNVSLGKIFADSAEWMDIRSTRLNFLSRDVQNALRRGVISECALELLKYGKDELVIIDGPLTIIDRYGKNQETFHIDDFEKFGMPHVDRLIDRRFVTIEDEARKVVERNKGTSYPSELSDVLNWIDQEYEKTREVSRYYKQGRALDVPSTDYTPQLLLKLLVDRNAPIVYFAYPITAIKEQPKERQSILRERIDGFRKKLDLCCAFVNPMELADLKVATEDEMDQTRHRDLNYFVRESDFVVAYIPAEDLETKGVRSELQTNAGLGGFNILICPTDKPEEKHPFGNAQFGNTRIDFTFRTEEAFFESIRKAGTEKEFEKLAVFLEEGSDRLRYERLFGNTG